MRVCVVGAGTRFLSGISYYTLRLANALAPVHEVSTVLMRQMLPTRLYPGRARVGERLIRLTYAASVKVFDGVDWYWLPSMIQALNFLRYERPRVMVFQWWTSTVLHSYLALALAARLLGARVVIEYHEVLDTGEARLPAIRTYAQAVAWLLVRLADAYVIHAEHDRIELQKRYPLGHKPILRIVHGPYDQYAPDNECPAATNGSDSPCNILFFGVIRPYKGLEDLVRAFDGLPPEAIEDYRLTVVGETWEGWTVPAELIAASRYRDRITFVNRYVPDDEAARFFATADMMVLPYHRSSASGPLHIAMSCGLPVVTTRVGGLPEAVEGYQGAILVPPGDPDALRAALPRAAALRGQRFADPHSWDDTVTAYDGLFAGLLKG